MGTPDTPANAPSAKLPAMLTRSVDMASWANSLVNGTPYVEPDELGLSRMLMIQAMSAKSEAELFSNTGVIGLQEAIPNTPGASTGSIVITNLYVAPSDMDDGLPCYVIIDTVNAETGETTKYTTGAGSIQGKLYGALTLGIWPIKCKIVRLDRKDKGGKYLFAMFPPD